MANKKPFNDTDTDPFEKKALRTVGKAEAAAEEAIEHAERLAKDKVHTLGNVCRKVTDLFSDAGGKAKEVVHQMETLSAEQKHRIESGIKARPWVSTAVAFGSGIVLAGLLKRRK